MEGQAIAAALTVGRDPLLLHTRNEILRKYGIATVSALSIQDAFQIFQSGDFDFVLLCHSVPEAERKQLITLMRNRRASTPVITISEVSFYDDPFADITTINDPETMLRDIGRVARLQLPID